MKKLMAVISLRLFWGRRRVPRPRSRRTRRGPRALPARGGAGQETNPPILFGGHHRLGPLAYNLTEEQRNEIEGVLTTLREQNATREDAQTAIQEKIDEFGVLDEQLDNEITQTQQKLTILYREQELRQQGYSWDEINIIIQEEFGLEETISTNYGMNFEWRFGP